MALTNMSHFLMLVIPYPPFVVFSFVSMSTL